MLSVQRLPPVAGTVTRMVSGRCRAGQLVEAAKKATETALNDACALEQTAPASRRADGILPLLLGVLLLAGCSRWTATKHTAPAEAHTTHHEHAAPMRPRYEWQNADSSAN